MSSALTLSVDYETVIASQPTIVGRSKAIYDLGNGNCLVRLIPSLTSFTFDRHKLIPGTEILRLDFYEMAAEHLKDAGISTAFITRVAPDAYLAELCIECNFETIVKNVAVGSTIRKYPGLFPEGYRFREPVVKFDFRINPEDQPISDDYLREAGHSPQIFKGIALKVNSVLCNWLAPRDLLDFCIVIGTRKDGSHIVTSEISPDGMRLRDADGQPLDKDLFRYGSKDEEIISVWTKLISSLRRQ